MKQILVLFTGGTIGSSVAGDTIDADEAARFKLLARFAQHSDNRDIRFTTLQPLHLLSENLHPSAWVTLINSLAAQDLTGYDGVIITHGTDTLAFSAAMLALYFNALPIPLLLVSSDYPLDDPKANGLNNFICAVEFIKQRAETGAFVAYQNAGQAMQVHLATRLLSCLPLSSDFISVQHQPYLLYENGQFTEQFSLPLRQTAPLPALSAFKRRVLLIKPYPGLDYRSLALQAGYVVLHDLYHSGTACATAQWGDAHSLTAFIRDCQTREIPVYLAPMRYSEQAYSSTRELIDAGATVVWNVTLEVAYAKLLLAYALFEDDPAIQAFLARDWAFESV